MSIVKLIEAQSRVVTGSMHQQEVIVAATAAAVTDKTLNAKDATMKPFYAKPDINFTRESQSTSINHQLNKQYLEHDQVVK